LVKEAGQNKMNSSLLDEIIAELIGSEADLERMNDHDLSVVAQILNNRPDIIWIIDHSRMSPVFINEAGREYYGFNGTDLRNEGFDLYSKFLHPDHFHDVHVTVNFFTQSPKGTFNIPYKVRRSDGEWVWTFSRSKAINHLKNGKVLFALAMVYDIVDLLNENKAAYHGLKKHELLAKYRTLTPREKQVLDLIAAEKTSHEIAEELFIESSTVDTHRKHLIRKLGVRSSVGLVRYALLCSDNRL
jgi:PAS domain S-box-containing protein